VGWNAFDQPDHFLFLLASLRAAWCSPLKKSAQQKIPPHIKIKKDVDF